MWTWRSGKPDGRPDSRTSLTGAGAGLSAIAVRPRRFALSWRARLIAVSLMLAVGASFMAILFLSYSVRFPDPLSLAAKRHAPVIHIFGRDKTLLATRGADAGYMPLDLLPAHVADALIAIEDRRFYDHWGIDPYGMLRAAAANIKEQRLAQGGSTLTQQLAKNLFLSPQRTLWRKVEEVTFALWLELRLSKRDILELYLNRVYFGGGAYGIEAASQRYFAKSARSLTIAEAAVLAGLMKAPSRYSPAVNPDAARARSRIVLQSMETAGTLTPAAHRAAREEALGFLSNVPRAGGGLEYAVEYALDRMPPVRASGAIEIHVETTLDGPLQKAAGAILSREIETNGAALDASQASLVVIETGGAIRALVGGRSWAESQYNRAVKARRQPGSAFKPIVYLAAIESGMTPETIGYDLPVNVKGWSPRNDNGRFRGAMSLKEALATSVNTIAVRLYLDLPKGQVVETARRLGIRSQLTDSPALALGASEVTLLELTRAYAIFAAGGQAVEPYVIERIALPSGDVLYQRAPVRPVHVVAPDAVAAMNAMLGAVVQTGTGRRAALGPHPTAGKTGTSQDFRDAWFVGYTAEMTAGVWVGNDGGQPMSRVMGGSLPARIWHNVMAVAHEKRPPHPLPGLETNNAPSDTGERKD